MELIGESKDLENMSKYLMLDKNFDVYRKSNVTEETMVFELGKLPVSTFCLIYLQGHGSPNSYLLKDFRITKDRKVQGLTSEVMYNTLLTSDTYRRLLLVSDFCDAGDYYRTYFNSFTPTRPNNISSELQYYLCLESEPEWKESPHWNGRVPAARAIHVAGANRGEEALEGDISGGFFTNAFATTWDEPLTLPARLHKLRYTVSMWIKGAKNKELLPQIPQIFCSFKPDLNDPTVLKKFQVGDLEEME
ncbi:hypothetical protein FRC12_025005 [Ceratobasidium sp. 428]|nr:hypothetical protein FRC12_025005 [Ceratobasidium sp. 428]